MSDPRVVPHPRVLTRAEATTLVGDDVPPAEPTVTAATIAVDADTGDPVFGYLPLGDVSELRRAVLGLGFGPRTKSQSRTFGYSIRRPVYRREGCSPSMLAAEHPPEHAVVCGFADRVAQVLGTIDPALVVAGRDAVAEVHTDWRMGESQLWTSGVINQSATLPYHRDAFNFPVWSGMPVLRRHIQGGYLRIPEYGAVIPCRDGWGVFFAGFQLVHGVTPMVMTRRDGYRYSVVYYALKGMRSCFETAQETAYAKRRRTEREQDMARGLASGEPTSHTLPGDRHGGLRYIGGRSQGEFDDPGARIPQGRPASYDRSFLTKKGGLRIIGLRGQGTFGDPDTARRRDLTGDPTAIEDAYLADEGDNP